MKNLFNITLSIVAVFILTACGPKDVQPIQSLSQVGIDEINISKIDVSLSPEFVNQVNGQIEKEEANIATQKDRIENPPGRTSYSRKQSADVAKGRLEESEKKIVALNEEMASIKKDVKTGLETILEGKFSGDRYVDLDLSINSFSLTNGGAVILVGGSDSMSGLLKISDSSSKELLGEYHIMDLDTNGAGGLLGVMIRGGNPRGDMIRQFSEKVSGVLAGEYSE